MSLLIIRTLLKHSTRSSFTSRNQILKYCTKPTNQIQLHNQIPASKMTDPRVLDLLERNKNFPGGLAPPFLTDIRKKARAAGKGGLVIISCSDPRVKVHEYLGLKRGEAAVIYNAGGRAAQAMSTINTLDTIAGVGTIMVVHHTDCGVTHVTDEEVREMLRSRAPSLAEEINKMSFMGYEAKNIVASVQEDISYLKNSPLIDRNTQVLGFVLDLKDGQLTEVKLESSKV